MSGNITQIKTKGYPFETMSTRFPHCTLISVYLRI